MTQPSLNQMEAINSWECCKDMRQLCGHNKGREDAIIAALAVERSDMLDALKTDACACKGPISNACYLHGANDFRTEIDATGTTRARHLARTRAIIDRIEGGTA